MLLMLLLMISSCTRFGLTQDQINQLPDLSSFGTIPSENFLVDLDQVTKTTPFFGSNSASYHDGAHVHFQNNGEIVDGSDPSSYPAIYAVASGIITHIDTYRNVNENYKYDITLTFAKDGNEAVEFQYSIEPMINPEDPEAYKPFILVNEGQTVSAGEIIATMLVKNGTGDGPHIHFNLYNGNFGKQAPAIFSSEIISEFTSKLREPGNCIGVDLTAEENPLGTGAVSCL